MQKVLFISEDQRISRLILAFFNKFRREKFALEWVQQYTAGLRAVRTGSFAAVLVDESIAGHSGIHWIREAREGRIKTPMILLRDSGSEALDFEALEAGAADSLEKPLLTWGLMEKVLSFALARQCAEPQPDERLDPAAHQQVEWMARFPNENPNPVMRVTGAGKLLYANDASSRISGWLDDTSQTLANPLMLLVQRAMRLKSQVQGDVQFGERAYSVSVMPIPPHGYANLYWHEITERIHMERALRDLQAEKVQYLAQIEIQRRLIRQREMERLQIARSLHDGPFQTLSAANMSLIDTMAMEEHQEHLERMQWVQQIFDQQIREFREFIQELRPPALVSFGLEATIRSHIEHFQTLFPHIQLEFNLMSDGKLLPEDTRLSLYRIYQEAMLNAGRHAGSGKIRVDLIVKDHSLILEVADDGIGFVVPKFWTDLALSEHLGLISMRERAEMMGGVFELQSGSGKGTLIRVSVPVV